MESPVVEFLRRLRWNLNKRLEWRKLVKSWFYFRTADGMIGGMSIVFSYKKMLLIFLFLTSHSKVSQEIINDTSNLLFFFSRATLFIRQNILTRDFY